MALLCVHRLDLPEEILSTIKDFAFVSFERKRIIDTHTFIHEIVLKHADLFDEDDNPFQYDVYHNRNWFYWSGTYQLKQHGFNIGFCKKCGNYLRRIYPRMYRGKPPVCTC